MRIAERRRAKRLPANVLHGAGLTIAALLAITSAPPVAFSLAAEPTSGAGSGSAVDVGRRIYREGTLPSGEVVRASVSGNVALSAADAACVTCHRRSGMGAIEGDIVPSPITGPLLFQPRKDERWEHQRLDMATPELRPAYTEETLKRAITDGVDPAGRTLHRLMPRYTLDKESLAGLIAYLKTLSAELSPGVTADTLHFATIVTGSVDKVRRDAMVTVLERYFADKNAESRGETQRSTHSPWFKTVHYQPYRKWALHVWDLHGPEASWQEQLDEFYQAQPVFAMIGGIGEGTWQPIHDFCKAHEIPCLFPTTDMPVTSETDFYNFYFSRGLALQAEALADYLRDREPPARAVRLVQLYRPGDPRSALLASAFRTALRDVAVEDRPLANGGTVTPSDWSEILTGDKPVTVVAWTRGDDLAISPVVAEDRRLAGIFLSMTLAGTAPKSLPDAMRNRVFLTYPYVLPDQQAQRLLRTTSWLRQKGIAETDLPVQANAHFAVAATNWGLRHMRSFFYRDYLIEKLEHQADAGLLTSMYPHLNVGPSQRFAANGCYIVRQSTAPDGSTVVVSPWIVP